MNSPALGHSFSRLVPYGCEILSSGISRAEVPSFTNCQGGREEVCMPDIDVREEGAIHQQRLAERLPGSVHGVTPEYQCDARSYPSVCTNISNLSTKLRSCTCMTLMSDLNRFPSATNQKEDQLVHKQNS